MPPGIMFLFYISGRSSIDLPPVTNGLTGELRIPILKGLLFGGDYSFFLESDCTKREEFY